MRIVRGYGQNARRLPPVTIMRMASMSRSCIAGAEREDQSNDKDTAHGETTRFSENRCLTYGFLFGGTRSLVTAVQVPYKGANHWIIRCIGALVPMGRWSDRIDDQL